MPNLYPGDSIEDDLNRIATVNGLVDADLLRAFMEQLGGCEDALWQLVKHRAERTYPAPTFNSKLIECLLADGYNIGRIRPMPALAKYRILYAYDNEYDDIYTLAVVEKVPHDESEPDLARYYDYERNHPISVRAVGEYDAIGVPRVSATR
ncbi:hypothetical protein [Paraburkholderia phosphatilytica]|uniref:hypothetical protein n=1 Tax=Paraburkholderia phosphatilytica TaxID=2282883 RepID=UPI000E4EA966|nr:hypothetical protein [Paraburkholderia phosphatilytica]